MLGLRYYVSMSTFNQRIIHTHITNHYIFRNDKLHIKSLRTQLKL